MGERSEPENTDDKKKRLLISKTHIETHNFMNKPCRSI